jgi:hypothetical protein
MTFAWTCGLIMIADMMIPMLTMHFVVAIGRTCIHHHELCAIGTKRRRKSAHGKSKPPLQANLAKQLDQEAKHRVARNAKRLTLQSLARATMFQNRIPNLK